jgi:ribosome-binding ATPase YchF (GTP1/OBG family)
MLKPLCLITAKPAMFVGNVSRDGFENNPFLDRLREYAAAQKARPWWPSAPRSKPTWPT